jgi:hypothetical protein
MVPRRVEREMIENGMGRARQWRDDGYIDGEMIENGIGRARQSEGDVRHPAVLPVVS